MVWKEFCVHKTKIYLHQVSPTLLKSCIDQFYIHMSFFLFVFRVLLTPTVAAAALLRAALLQPLEEAPRRAARLWVLQVKVSIHRETDEDFLPHADLQLLLGALFSG